MRLLRATVCEAVNSELSNSKLPAMAWNRYGTQNAVSNVAPTTMVSGAPSLGGMNDTYRPGAFYNYMGLPHGATRTYMEPGDASPTKKLAQLKELLDQNLIEQSDFDAQKSAILSALVERRDPPKMKPRGSAMGMSTSQAQFRPPAEAPPSPSRAYSQFAAAPAPVPAPSWAPAEAAAAAAAAAPDDALVSFMDASPLKAAAPAAAPADAGGGPHGVSISVGATDDALDGYMMQQQAMRSGGASAAAPPAQGPGARSASALGFAADEDRATRAAIRLQGEFGAGQSHPRSQSTDPRISVSLAQESAFGAPAPAASPVSDVWGFGRTDAQELPVLDKALSDLDVDKALTLIRDKIRGRLEGGPAELRRAFQFFDRDGSGAIDHEEMRSALKLRTNLEFSDQMVGEIMKRYDEGSGEVGFNQFAKLVMGSGQDDMTGWSSPSKGGRNMSFDHFNMNEEVHMVNIKRQLKKQWKRVKTEFGHKGGVMDYAQIQDMLYVMNLDMSEKQFAGMMADVDVDGDQQITYMEFINFLKRQEIKHNTEKMLPKISNLSVEEAVLMIREKLIAQLTTAKAATNLRRAFQAVDLDGGGTIEKDEIKEVLRVKSSLDFSDDLWDRIWVRCTAHGRTAPACSMSFWLAVAAGLVAVELCNTPGLREQRC